MELFRLVGNIIIDNTNANRAISETSQEANNSEKKVSEAFNKIGSAASTIAKGIGVAGAAIGGAFIASIESTREYRQEMGKLDTAFVTNGHSSQAAKQTYSELNAVLGETDQAVEAANHLALLTDNEADLQKWTDICTGVYATFGASLPIEGLTEAANETAKVGQVTGPLADALNWAGISEDAFNEKLAKCSSEQERQKLIMETLNSTYSEASTQYQNTNKDILESRKAQERLSDAIAKVGEVGEPVLTAIKNSIADMAEIAVPKIQAIIEKFQDCITWIQENRESIKVWSGVIAIAIATAAGFVLVLTWSMIMKKAAAAIEVVTTAMKALNVAMKANLIGLIVTAIIGLVAMFIYLWNNVDGFRQFWIDAWEMIKNSCLAAWDWIKNASSSAWEWIKDIWSGIGSWFSEKYNKVKDAASSAMDSVKQFFTNAWNSIKGVWNAVIGFFNGIWNGIKSVFASVTSWFNNIFSSAWNGIKTVWNNAKTYFNSVWSGIKNTFSSVASWFGNTFRNAWNNIKSVFSSWGSFFSGLWTSIKSKFGSIGSSLGTSMGNAVKSGMNGVISTVEKAINKGIGLINSAISLANKLPGINVGKVSKISLPRLAKGGVLSKGQIGLLEGSGAEAVVPLEKNTKWIDMVASQFESRLKGNDNNNELVDSNFNKVINLLEKLLERNIYLDSGTLVGELAPIIDNELGNIEARKIRGNI